jgi:hypothetical protein
MRGVFAIKDKQWMQAAVNMTAMIKVTLEEQKNDWWGASTLWSGHETCRGSHRQGSIIIWVQKYRLSLFEKFR